jgi:hypothetical protein
MCCYQYHHFVTESVHIPPTFTAGAVRTDVWTTTNVPRKLHSALDTNDPEAAVSELRRMSSWQRVSCAGFTGWTGRARFMDPDMNEQSLRRRRTIRDDSSYLDGLGGRDGTG